MGCLCCTLEGGCPDCEGTVAGRLFDKVRENLGIFLTAGREVGISTNLSGNIVHGFTVLGGMYVSNTSKARNCNRTYSTYPDAPGLDVQVHEIVYHSRL